MPRTALFLGLGRPARQGLLLPKRMRGEGRTGEPAANADVA